MGQKLYTRYKIFHYKDKLDSLSRETDTILPPLHIRIKPTNACNHNCNYCAYRVDALQLGCDMNVRDSIPREKMSEIIDDIVDMGVKAVTFSGGGEPFCYPYLIDTVKKLADSPIKFASLTNGGLLAGEVAEIFAHKGTWLRVSIDGYDGPSYAKYRGVSEKEFDKVIGNLRAFKAFNGGCYTGASVIIDENNAAHVYELVSLLKDTGLDSVKLSGCVVANEGQLNNQYHQKFWSVARGEIEKVMNNLPDDGFEVYDTYHLLSDKFAKNYNWCPYMQILSVIGADLNVYTCQDKAYNLTDGVVGSIKDQSFKDFWMNNKEKFYNIDPSVNCNHHCVSNDKNKMLLEYLEADREHLAFV